MPKIRERAEFGRQKGRIYIYKGYGGTRSEQQRIQTGVQILQSSRQGRLCKRACWARTGWDMTSNKMKICHSQKIREADEIDATMDF